MEQYVFAEQVKERFRYLIDDHGFSVVDERYDPEAFGNSLVDFQSSNTVIRVLLDRGQVLIDIGPCPRSPDYWFGLASVVEFLAPEADEPAYIFPETWDSYYDKIDWQVVRLARVLRQYCAPVLRGEFSRWKEMAERRSKEAGDIYRALTGKDPIKITSEELGEKIRKEENRRRYRALTGKDLLKE